MTHKYVVLAIFLFHYGSRFAVFVLPQNLPCGKTIGGFPAFLFLLGICFFLVDIEIFPRNYSSQHVITFHIIEGILGLLAIEFTMITIWSRFENLLVTFIKHVLSRGSLYQEMGGDNFVALIVGAIALCFLVFAINMTNLTEKFAIAINGAYNWIAKYYERLRGRNFSSSQQNGHTTILHCQPAATQRMRTRDPCCPVHGDLEVNQNSRRKK